MSPEAAHDNLSSEQSAFLKNLVEGCQKQLASNERAQQYLRKTGIENESIWRAFRLGSCHASLVANLDDAGRGHLRALGMLPNKGTSGLAREGIVLPAFDPRRPDEPCGLIKIAFGQNKHSFMTAPRGVACTSDACTVPRVVVADAPLLGLRLAQAGCQGVLIAETPEVLLPLGDWLCGKEQLACVSFFETGLQAFTTSMPKARPVLMPINMASLSIEARDILGLPPEAFKAAPAAPVPLTQALLVQLVHYAQARVANGEGQDLLRDQGADNADFCRTLGLGYLPPGFAKALSRDAARAFSGKLAPHSILVPAFDDSGVPCDAMCIGPEKHRRNLSSLWEAPSGLIGSKAASAYDDVIVTDSFKRTAKLFQDGRRNVLLLRGEADAERNAARLFAAGVESATLICWRHAHPMARKLQSAGIAVSIGPAAQTPSQSIAVQANAPIPLEAVRQPRENTQAPPACGQSTPPVGTASTTAAQPHTPPGPPACSGYDAKTDLASFRCGDAVYHIEIADDSQTRLEVRLEREGKLALDRFDLASEAQRRRFAISAALKTKVPFEQICEHLVQLLEAARKIRGQHDRSHSPSPMSVEMSAAQRDEALAFLRRADLLDAIAGDMQALGWVGEEANKRLLYLIAASRKLPTPLSAAQRAPSGAGKSFELEQIAALIPPEDIVHVSRLTDSSLYYQRPGALLHKLLLIDEADALTPEVLITLRVLQSRGALSQTLTERDAATGRQQTHFAEVRGPVAVLTSTAGELEEQFLSRCYQLAVDDSPEQTGRILSAQRALRTDRNSLAKRAAIMQRHHAMQRLLESKPVLIPFASRIAFPASNIRHRREQERFLNLIEASALLHQFQRLSEEGILIADERDFQIASLLAGPLVADSSDELSKHGRELLTLLHENNLRSFERQDVARLKPHWTGHQLRSGLEELLAVEFIASPKRTRPRRYELLPGAVLKAQSAGIRLLDTPMGDSADFCESPFTNTTPIQELA